MVNRFFILMTFILTIYSGKMISTKHINDVNYNDLYSIVGIGQVKASCIIEERNKKPYKDLEDFRNRTKGKVGETVTERIAKKFRF